MNLLAALEAALDGWKKQAAHAVYPDVDQAPAKLSRILRGDLNPPVDLLAIALQGPNPRPLLDAIGDLAGVEWTPTRVDPGEVRTQALVALGDVRDALREIQARLDQADELDDRERRRMRKAGEGALDARRAG